MNIGMTSFGADGGKSGISQYVIQLLRQFARLGGDNEFDFYTYDSEQQLYPLSGAIRPLLFPDHLRSPLRNIAWHQWSLSRWCRRRAHDVLFLPAGNRRLPLRTPCPTVGTVHDLSLLHVRGKYDWTRSTYVRQVLPRLIRRLTQILTISESSKRDIVEYVGVAPERVVVCPLAVDHEVYRPRSESQTQASLEAAMATDLSERMNIRSPFILYVSRLEHPGKNHVRLIQAFELLKRRHAIPHQLLLIGSDWTRAEAVHRAAAASRWTDDILLPGFVSAEHLPWLYNAADLHVFPSLYEGFGLPVLEAMASGAPTACSNCSSLPEVAGGAAELFDPKDIESMAAAMGKLLLDHDYRQTMAEQGVVRANEFSWERTATHTLTVLKEAAGC